MWTENEFNNVFLFRLIFLGPKKSEKIQRKKEFETLLPLANENAAKMLFVKKRIIANKMLEMARSLQTAFAQCIFKSTR